MEEEISLKELYKIGKKHFFTIIIAMIMGVLVSVVVMMFFITPKYSSEAQLLVNQQGDVSQTTIQNNEIQANIQLINTYSDVITGHSVLSQVISNLEGNYTVTNLEEAISVNQSPNSQAFNIKVTMESPEEAQAILNEVINVFETTIKEVYESNVASIFVLSPATFNANRVSPKLMIFVLIGAVAGLVISILIIMIIELVDTTVKEDDFLIQLGLINLGHVYELSSKELKQSRLSTREKNNSVRERV